jgi:cyclohexanone monooxygenase
MERRAGYEVYGEGGLALSDKWRNGVSTLYGMNTHGFPNCFIVGLSQVGMSANIPHVIDVQSRHIAYVLGEARQRGARTLDTTPEAEAAWVKTVMDASVMSLAFLESCTPGYYNNEGKPNGELVRRNGAYAPGIMGFAKILDDWRAEGALRGIEFG